MHGDKTEIFNPLACFYQDLKEGSEGSVIGPFPACPGPCWAPACVQRCEYQTLAMMIMFKSLVIPACHSPQTSRLIILCCYQDHSYAPPSSSDGLKARLLDALARVERLKGDKGMAREGRERAQSAAFWRISGEDAH